MPGETQKPDIDIESLMNSIREQVMAENGPTGPGGEPIVNIRGKYLPEAFYQELYQAAMNYSQLEASLLVGGKNIPLIGPLINKLRHKLDRLVLFYVNQVARNQSRVNMHLLRAVSVLGEEVERLSAEPAADEGHTP